MRVLVTGANGFVGSALAERLVAEGRHVVVGAVRDNRSAVPTSVARVEIGPIGPETDWARALAQVDAVVHLAARVHVMSDSANDPLTEYRKTNVAATCALAQQAARAGAKRFVFISTLKVHGESGRFSEADPAVPADPYGASKHEAEVGLRAIAAGSGMDLVVIRPPLVYGPGVQANFRALMIAVSRGIPLPFGAVDNRRSLLSLANLVDFIVASIEHPAAANEDFLLCDGEDLSTPELIRRLAWALGRPARLLPIPVGVLVAGATLLGKRAAAQRLLGTLQADSSKARQLLRWEPPVSVDEGLRLAAESLK